VLCQPCLEPIVRVSKKHQVVVAAAVQASVQKKATKKQKRVKGSSRSGGQASEQEIALAKPLKQCEKFKAQSSRLSVIEKTSSMKLCPGLLRA
jgi:hypothetical protein